MALSLTAAWRSAAIGFARQATRELSPQLAEPEEFTRIAGSLSEAQDLAPSHPEISFKQGILYTEEAYRSADATIYRDIRFAQAHASFERAVRLAPARGRYWFELAWTEGNLRNDEIADPLFEHALLLEPTWSRLRANYALYLASRGRIEQALHQLEAGRSMSPGLSPYEAVSIIGPHVDNDPAILNRAAGDGQRSKEAVSRYLEELQGRQPR